MKKAPKKLNLTKDTLRSLEDPALGTAVGGVFSRDFCSYTQPHLSCLVVC